MPLMPVLGITINGARIWINLGPLSFQPGEVAKVMLVHRSSPATSCCTATPWRWPAAGSPASTCPAAATSGRSW